MGRRPGSRNKTTLAKEKAVLLNSSSKKLRVKQIVDMTQIKADHLKTLNTKKGRPIMPKHILKITDWLYITCDSRQWILKEVNDKINPKTNEKYPDIGLFYTNDLAYMIKLLAGYSIKVPKDIVDLNAHIQSIYDLIDKRIPKNIRPKDLFVEYQTEGQDNGEE